MRSQSDLVSTVLAAAALAAAILLSPWGARTHDDGDQVHFVMAVAEEPAGPQGACSVAGTSSPNAPCGDARVTAMHTATLDPGF